MIEPGAAMPFDKSAVGTEPPPIDIGSDALFLDLDGTLAPIQSQPDQVEIASEVLERLARLAEVLNGRVAVVSGRAITDIDRLTEGIVPAAAGVHGLERRHGTNLVRVLPAEGVAAAARAFRTYAAAHPGLLVEDKRLGITLHFRQAPEHAAEARRLAEQLAAEHDLVLQTGKMVVELRTPGGDKGAALDAFMSEAPFAGSRPWFVGDDDTDEAGFAAAKRHGGAGILVGPARPTAAGYRLSGVEAVASWLASGLSGDGGR